MLMGFHIAPPSLLLRCLAQVCRFRLCDEQNRSAIETTTTTKVSRPFRVRRSRERARSFTYTRSHIRRRSSRANRYVAIPDSSRADQPPAGNLGATTLELQIARKRDLARARARARVCFYFGGPRETSVPFKHEIRIAPREYRDIAIFRIWRILRFAPGRLISQFVLSFDV